VSDEKAAAQSAVVIKKYANRRLYNTSTSTYVTLDDLASMVKAGTDFVVYDAKTGEEITRSVLTQIIFEEENKGTNLLPINFLRQLIRFYGDSMQAFVPGYLEFSLENLGKEQEKFRAQMMEAWGADPFKAMQDHAARNMTMFSEAMRVFNPFAAALGQQGFPAPGQKPPQGGTPQASGKEDLQALKDQLAAMQQRLDNIANK
jgi:polyhydroxyalkanoate synthesis repressor PhaR